MVYIKVNIKVPFKVYLKVFKKLILKIHETLSGQKSATGKEQQLTFGRVNTGAIIYGYYL